MQRLNRYRQHTPSPRGRGLAGAVVAVAALLAAGLAAGPATAAPRSASFTAPTASVPAAAASGVDGFTAGDAAVASVDLSGSWSFTPAGLTEMKKRMPHMDFSELEKDPDINKMQFTVNTVVNYIESKVNAPA